MRVLAIYPNLLDMERNRVYKERFLDWGYHSRRRGLKQEQILMYLEVNDKNLD
jgi:hypothetical protein